MCVFFCFDMRENGMWVVWFIGGWIGMVEVVVRFMVVLCMVDGCVFVMYMCVVYLFICFC